MRLTENASEIVKKIIYKLYSVDKRKLFTKYYIISQLEEFNNFCKIICHVLHK